MLSSKVIDLTHDTLPELKWRPIMKVHDKIPPVAVLKDKTLLREWEAEQKKEFFSFVYDRQDIDYDVFKKLQDQGDIIKMTIDHNDLTRDKNFWKVEQEIQDKARFYLGGLKRLK